jgi:periplasmic protein TonB
VIYAVSLEKSKSEEDTVFADYLDGGTWANRSHRGWTTLLSFAVQTTAIGGLLLLPLLSMQALPPLQLMAALVAPAPGPAPAVPARSHVAPTSNMIGRTLMMPRQIPRKIANLNETEAPPALEFPGTPGVPGGTGSAGARNSMMEGFGSGTNAMPILSPPPAVHQVRVSHMMEGNLIHRVQPVYPPLARQARIQGTVVLRAIISRDGRIENLQVLSGHPMLVPAAIEAVRQWRYQPYILNDQPVEVETQITVNFSLSGG